MKGPFPAGTHPVDPRQTSWEQCLRRGTKYRVVKAFTDADGGKHEPGETWTFLASDFLPYDDELTIAVVLPDGSEWRIRMIWMPEWQGAIIESFAEYVAPIGWRLIICGKIAVAHLISRIRGYWRCSL